MKQKYLVICIDDDEHFVQSLTRFLPNKVAPACEGFECLFEFVTSVEEFNAILSSPDNAPELAVLISDQVMVGITGIELIEAAKATHPHTLCVLLTGHVATDSVKYAVSRRLVDQYVSKPIEDMDIFTAMVVNLLKRYHIGREEHRRTEQLALTVMQLRALNEKVGTMLAVTERIALLARDLKNMEFSQVAAIGFQESLTLFQAGCGALCLPGKAGSPPTMHRRQCSRSEPDLLSGAEQLRALSDEIIVVPEEARHADRCTACKLPAIRIPLTIRAGRDYEDDSDARQHGFLCMCGIDASVMASPDLLKYNASLVRDILAASLDNAQLYQRVKNESETDYLTGAKTRRFLYEMLAAEHERSMRHRQPFCLMIIDVDHFKRINDNCGHPEGDRMLCELADMLRKEKRASDLLARYGGDEFAVLLPQTDFQGAIGLAERMRARAATILTSEGRPLTISCGVAEWSPGPKGEAIDDVMRRADVAMYQAKQAGQDCVSAIRGAPLSPAAT